MSRHFYPSVLVIFGFIAMGSAQERIDPLILSVRTDLVTLTVTVVDRRGTPVTGLRQEHFSVYDNGDRQAIQFFTSEDVAATIGLVVDSSGSMRGRREEMAAVASGFAAIRQPLGEFFAIRFNEMVWPQLPPQTAFTDDPNQLRSPLIAAPREGMTALYDAVDRGLEHLQHGTRDRKVLIVVSDGGDNASRQKLDAVLDRARRAEAVIYAVTMFDPDNRDARPQVLKALARETGGRVFVVESTAEITGAFAQMAHEIRSGYTIGFAPPETVEGGFRSIRVAVDGGPDRRLVARTRAGYHARPSVDTGK